LQNFLTEICQIAMLATSDVNCSCSGFKMSRSLNAKTSCSCSVAAQLEFTITTLSPGVFKGGRQAEKINLAGGRRKSEH
jgi:hypothetical protein